MTEEEKKAQEEAAKAAAQQSGQQTTALGEQPSEQPAATVSPTSSLESEADIDRRLTEIWQKQVQEDKEQDEKRLQRQMAARSLGDLGHAFVDLIKGSEGAVVGPRDVTAAYNRLDDRQKQLYDNYRARLDLLRQKKADRDRARAAQAAAEKRAEMQEEGRNERAKLAAEAKMKAAQEAARARIRARMGTGGEQEMIIPYAGQDYVIQKKAYDGRMAQLYSYLKQNNLFSKYAGAETAELKNVMALLTSNNSSMAEESSKAKLAIACLVSINEIPGDSEHAENIIKILKGTYGKPQAAAQAAKPAQTTSSTTAPWLLGEKQ